MNTNQGMKVTFNGIDLSKWIEVSDVQRNIGQNRKATLIKVGTSNGKRFIHTSADEGTIVVKGDVMYQLVSQRRDLAAALATDEPVQLIFDDEPDKYYMAICDQQTTMSEEQFLGEAVITFVVPDDLAHSVATSTVSGTSGADIVINNAGSAPTAPVLTATMTGDNGLVGWANDQGGVLQFGSPDEIDGLQKEESEEVFHYTMDSAPTGPVANTGTIVYKNFNDDPSKPNTQSGPFHFGEYPGYANAAGERGNNDYWTGPTLSGKISTNKSGSNKGNLMWENRINLHTGVTQNGRSEFNLTHGTDVVMSLILYDASNAADQIIFEGWYRGQRLFKDNLQRNYFIDGDYHIVLAKMGDQATFRLDVLGNGGLGLEIPTLGGLSDEEIDGWTVWFAGFGSSSGWKMLWDDSRMTWVNVDYFQDIPNRFKAGDIVVADVANKTVSVNGAIDPTLQTVGNMWDSFGLHPGENTIHPVASTWANPFTAKIEYRKAWY